MPRDVFQTNPRTKARDQVCHAVPLACAVVGGLSEWQMFNLCCFQPDLIDAVPCIQPLDTPFEQPRYPRCIPHGTCEAHFDINAGLIHAPCRKAQATCSFLLAAQHFTNPNEQTVQPRGHVSCQANRFG